MGSAPVTPMCDPVWLVAKGLRLAAMASALPAALLSLAMVGHSPAAMVGHGPAAPYCVAVELLALRNVSLGTEHGTPAGRTAMWSAAQQCGAGQQCGALGPHGASATRAPPADDARSEDAPVADGPSTEPHSDPQHGLQCGVEKQCGASAQQCGAGGMAKGGILDSMMHGSDERPMYQNPRRIWRRSSDPRGHRESNHLHLGFALNGSGYRRWLAQGSLNCLLPAQGSSHEKGTCEGGSCTAPKDESASAGCGSNGSTHPSESPVLPRRDPPR